MWDTMIITRNLLRRKLNCVRAKLGSVNSTIGMYLELDKITYTCNLNLISRFFKSGMYISPVEVFPAKIFPIETIYHLVNLFSAALYSRLAVWLCLNLYLHET